MGHSHDQLICHKGKTGNVTCSALGDFSSSSLSDAFHCSGQTTFLYTFPLIMTIPQVSLKAQCRSSQAYPHSPSTAEMLLVLRPPCAIDSASHTASSSSRLAHSEPRLLSQSHTQPLASHGVTAVWLNEEEQCSVTVQQVLLNNRKSSTRIAYLAKCGRGFWYSSWLVGSN